MIYLNVSATQTQAAHEVAAYKSVGFNYGPGERLISTTPTNANYGAIVQKLQSDGVKYVTEYSDASSAERLLQAMQQANYAPEVVDWFSEEYSPQFAQQTAPESNGDLVLMSATAAYEEASSNPGMQLMESWLNRVAPGYHQDIFAILAWSAGLAFEQAAKEVGPDLTRAAVISKIQGITNWTGGGVTPPVNIGAEDPGEVLLLHEDPERRLPAGLPERAQHLRLQQRLLPVLGRPPPCTSSSSSPSSASSSARPTPWPPAAWSSPTPRRASSTSPTGPWACSWPSSTGSSRWAGTSMPDWPSS